MIRVGGIKNQSVEKPNGPIGKRLFRLLNYPKELQATGAAFHEVTAQLRVGLPQLYAFVITQGSSQGRSTFHSLVARKLENSVFS